MMAATTTARAKPAPGVWVLFHETNTGHSDSSDGYVDAVFPTEKKAKTAQLLVTRRAIAAGVAVYYNPDTEEEEPTGYWTDDWRVEFQPLETNSRRAARDIADNHGWVRTRKAAK